MNAPGMSLVSVAKATAALVLGGAIGLLIGRSVAWAVVGAIVGAATAVMILFVGVRPVVAVPVGVGAGIGSFVGGTIVGVICEPQGCAAFEATAAIVTGIGALVGIGLVVALATRSFEEHSAAVARGSTPPTTGCGDPSNSD
jgi:hypothetical protein